MGVGLGVDGRRAASSRQACAASDSRQARSSGSAISRRPSPSSLAARRAAPGGPGAWRLVDAALAEGDLVDRGIAEEAVDPLDDQRGEMLHQRRMRALDGQGQRAARLLALPGSGSIRASRPWRSARRRSRAQRLTTAPWTKPKRLKRDPGDVADEVARRARMAAARGIFLGFGTRGLRHRRRPCHSDSMPASAAKRLLATL